METTKVSTRLSTEERETILVYSYSDKKWYMDTTVPKHVNKAKKQGWVQTDEYIYEDGTVCGGAFIAPERAITIRNAEKRQMSDKQMSNLPDGEDEDEE